MENWINKLERKIGKYAIPNLMYYIIILYAFGFALNLFAGDFYYQYLGSLTPKIPESLIWLIFLHKFKLLVDRTAVLCYNS